MNRENETDALKMWVVYDHPTDFPDHFVARLWTIVGETYGPTTLAVLDTSLDGIRERVKREAPGAVCMARAELDDPKIVETWL